MVGSDQVSFSKNALIFRAPSCIFWGGSKHTNLCLCSTDVSPMGPPSICGKNKTTTLVRGLDGICGDFEDYGAFAGCFVMMDDLMDVQNWVVVSNMFLNCHPYFLKMNPV